MTGRTIVAVLVVCLLFAVGLGAATGAVSAQAENSTDNQSNATETVEQQLGDLSIHSYHYDDNRTQMVIQMTWEGRAPTTVSMTEYVDLEDHSGGTIGFESIRMTPHQRTVVRVDARKFDGIAAVSVATEQSAERGEIALLKTGESSGFSPFDGPASWSLVFLAGFISLGGAFWGTKRWLERKREQMDERQMEEVR